MINLNYRSGLPLYRQIMDGFKQLMLSGAIKEDERLPSVRELASQLQINPNTIQRAYRELETEGFIATLPGKGVYAVDSENLKTHEIEEKYGIICTEAQSLINLGLELNEITTQIKKRLNHKRGD